MTSWIYRIWWGWENQSQWVHLNYIRMVTFHTANPSAAATIRAAYTFLTNLGQNGCDAWTLARIAGHSNISMSKRYVHPSEHAVLNAIERLQAGGCNFGSGQVLPSGELGQRANLTPEPMYNYDVRARSSVG